MLGVMRLRPFRYASPHGLLFTLTLLGLPRGLPAAASTQPSTKPAFVTRDRDGMWNDHGYILHNNMWNAKKYRVDQTLRAVGYDDWSVTATADNSKHDGAVKSYPNVHKDYHNWKTGDEPRLSAFTAITSTFGASSPHVGVYNVAYDIWLNGVPGNREVMIWTENFHQVPAGRAIATGVTFSGHAWDVYATGDNHYLALVAREPLTHGSLDLKVMLDYLTRQGRIPNDATLGAIDFGVEIVSTDGKPATFTFNGFSISDKR
jgi:hypothetical protein